jgi:hypothetical protein
MRITLKIYILILELYIDLFKRLSGDLIIIHKNHCAICYNNPKSKQKEEK